MWRRILLLMMASGAALAGCDALACLSYADQGPLCRVCNPLLGFYASGDGECLRSNIEGCEVYNYSGGCYRCAAGYTLVGCGCRLDTMLPALDNCVAYDGLGKSCVTCDTGFYLSGSACRAVTSQVANCITYASATSCGKCASGFFLLAGACVANPPNCNVAVGATCLRCGNGYSFASVDKASELYRLQGAWWMFQGNSIPSTTFTCTQVQPNCAIFLTPTTCRTCVSGYYLSGSDCLQVTSPVTNCAVHDSATTCGQCITNYYPATASSCLAVPVAITNCVSHSSPTTCIRCARGFFLSSGVCVAVTTVIPNCEVYSSATACQYCASGYFIQSGNCRAVLVWANNCVAMNTSGCIACANNFFLQAGRCVAVTTTVTNCARYASATDCASCLNGYYLNGGACVGFIGVLNCAIYEGPRVCRFCARGFYLVAGVCQTTATIANCQYNGASGKCLQCFTGYILTPGDLSCVRAPIKDCDVFSSRTECVSCVTSYWFDSVNNKCVATTSVQNCDTYVSATQCRRCLPSFALQGNTCVNLVQPLNNCDISESVAGVASCKVCATLYVLHPVSNICEPIAISSAVSNCRFYSSSATDANDKSAICQQCSQNYYLSGNTCLPAASEIENCDNQDSDGNCLRCQSGFFPLAFNFCFASSTQASHCFEYDSNDVCIYCDADYILNAGACVPISGFPIKNCNFHAAATVCALCEAGYFFSAGGCAPVATALPNCLYYSSEGICLECVDAYFLESGQCQIRMIANCKFYSSTNACAVCNDLYNLNNGFCVAISTAVLNCIEYSSATQCAVCDQGYYLSGNSCSALTGGLANCRVYASASTCLYCREGYFVSAGVCAAIVTPISGCRYYGSAETRCIECLSGFALAPAGASCVANCESASDSACLRCAPSYYPSGSGCAQVTQPIANCVYYSAATTCLYCSSTYLVNYATNSCEASPSLPSTNCRWASTGSCFACNPDYKVSLVNGVATCVSTGPVPGCLLVAADGVSCEICKTGFFQKAYRGACYDLPAKKDCYCYAGDTYTLPF